MKRYVVEIALAAPTLHAAESACRVLGVEWGDTLSGFAPERVEHPEALLALVAPGTEGIEPAAAEGLAREAARAFFEVVAQEARAASVAVAAAYKAAGMEQPQGGSGGLTSLRRDLAAALDAEAFEAVVFHMPIGRLFEWLGLRGLKIKLDELDKQLQDFRNSL